MELSFGKANNDEVFTAGHQRGIDHSGGRSAANPAVYDGMGGMLHGKRY
ncbi:hypothetical protein [Pontibacter oryzae]|nr:hypothetical protein [Pontibacter oryzae]